MDPVQNLKDLVFSIAKIILNYFPQFVAILVFLFLALLAFLMLLFGNVELSP